ncbi:fatty-acyl-CoA synthase [Auritidibacter ignavus]|nr:fatty-acyl-CoA synthase [Auritidibacter ignavus]
MTPVTYLDRTAAIYPDHTAVECEGTSWTYREFHQQVRQLAGALSATVSPGQTVSVVAPNLPEMLVAHFAVPMLGAVLNPLNPRLTSAEFRYILDHAEARIVFVDPDVADRLTPVCTELGIEMITLDEQYQRFIADAPAPPAVTIAEDDPIALNYTSGTTGPPKGVVYTHRGAYLAALSAAYHYGYDATTRYLWTLPMFHCNGWTTPWAVTAAGGTHLCLRAVRQDAIWDQLDTVTHLCGAPVVCATILDSPRAHPVPGVKLTTAGAAPPPSIIAGLEELGITPIPVYGLTETYGPFSITQAQPDWEDRHAKLSRQGVPMIHAGELAVVDPQMNFLPHDGESLGEVVVRGNGVMAEYFKDPDHTATAFAGGWYHTGDVGVIDPDGYLRLTDRLKDIIISGGENISSIEVEGVIHAPWPTLSATSIPRTCGPTAGNDSPGSRCPTVSRS